jgi:hypothetical protein
VDWRYFYDVDTRRPPQASKRIDTILVHALTDLPTSVVGNAESPEEHSLAYRDLVRGEAAAVLLGLIDGDSTSYRNAETEWRPEMPGAQIGYFAMSDLLRYVGEA